MTGQAPDGATSGRKAIVVLFLALVVAGMGQSFVFAVLPPVGRAMGMADVQISLIIVSAAVLFVIAAPIWGRIIEVWGRRPVMAFGLGSFAVTTALFGFVVELRLAFTISVGLAFTLLMVLRALFALGAGGIFPAAQAYLADSSPPERRTAAVALISIAFGLGMVAGPAAAGGLAGVGLIAPFYGIAALALISAISIKMVLQPAPRLTKTRELAPQPLVILRFLPFLAMGSLTLMTLATVQQVTGFRIQDLFGLNTAETAETASIALIVMAVAMITTQSTLVRRLKVPPIMLVRMGSPLAIVALAIMSVSDEMVWLSIGMAVFGSASGMIMPGFMASVTLAAGPDQQGRAAGLLASAQGTGFIIGPPASAALYQLYPVAPYWLAMVLMAGIALIAFLRPLSPVGHEAHAQPAD
ncbi:MAG: MFS transporter [Pseudomonadota bacterium]